MLGKVYERVANICLAERYPYLTTNNRHALLERGNVEEVDEMARAADIIRAEITAISPMLSARGCALPDDFEEIILKSRTPELTLEATRQAIQAEGFDEVSRGHLAYKAISAIHALWVEQHPDLFNKRVYYDTQFLFLPVEFIGSTHALHYYPYTTDLLSVVSLRPETRFFQMVYSISQESVMKRHRITSRDALMQYISDYTDEKSPISHLNLTENRDVIERIAEQVSTASPQLLLS